jgi:hypothetical protein
MEAHGRSWSSTVFEQLLRRAQIVIQHHRYRQQPIDAREVVDRVRATYERRLENFVQYRGVLEEAVRSLIHGVR